MREKTARDIKIYLKNSKIRLFSHFVKFLSNIKKYYNRLIMHSKTFKTTESDGNAR